MTIVEKIKELPPEKLRQVEDLVDHLFNSRANEPGRFLRQDWAGALEDFRDTYTSLELQRKTLDWCRN